MDAAGIIWRLRNGDPPTQDELNWFAAGLADQSVSDAQAGAFAMAVCLNGLGDAGRRDLTLAMRDSGATLSWDFDAPILDKHSTGGIGDCVSLILAPLLAAAGVVVPMISGRGLGHTGGTLDKLEAIPGLRTQFDKPHLDAILSTAGCVIAGATGDIAPADRRLYAVRDVTGTVDSLDLITASILSKKLAAGLQGLVLDVKCGSGAFMQTPSDARDLAKSLVETANAAGCKTSAIISDMNAPLAPALGNALEVRAALEVLAGSAKGRLRGFVHSPCGTGLCHASQYADEERNCTVSGSVGSGRSTGSFRADDCRHGRADWICRELEQIPARSLGHFRGSCKTGGLYFGLSRHRHGECGGRFGRWATR